MVSKIRPPFQIVPEYDVTRQFTVSGKTQKVGDKFPASRYAHDERKLRQLYENRNISLPKSRRPAGALEVEQPVETPAPASPDPALLDPSLSPRDPAAPGGDGADGAGEDDDQPVIVKVAADGGGWYTVSEPDGAETRHHGKSNVDAYLASNGWVVAGD